MKEKRDKYNVSDVVREREESSEYYDRS